MWRWDCPAVQRKTAVPVLTLVLALVLVLVLVL
jgi:hypothetical protein